MLGKIRIIHAGGYDPRLAARLMAPSSAPEGNGAPCAPLEVPGRRSYTTRVLWLPECQVSPLEPL